MGRRVVVAVVALLAVLGAGGAALAAGGQERPGGTAAPASTGVPPEPGDLEEAAEPEGEGGGFGAERSAQARAYGRCKRDSGGGPPAKAACAALRPGPAHLHPAHPGRGPDGERGRVTAPDGAAGEDEAPEDDEGSGFGVQRSAEARAFGACMREQGDQAACRDLKPGPAHEHPAHPGRGPRDR